MKRVPKCIPNDHRHIHRSTKLHNSRRGGNAERVIGGPHPDPCTRARVFQLPANQTYSGSDYQRQR
jgi:hypothetical protein